MSPQDLTAIAVLSVALANLDVREFFTECKSEEEDPDISSIRDAGRAIITAKAQMTRNYFVALKIAGFTPTEALELTKMFKPELEFKQ